ncbi:(2Fe-2S) ferredoxin domain-containing protein [Peredibacter sp. HCB2-198]|uniref:(2Fe-2S) ferredoxin domain-containing protein n=1 Tax=Peredibacter sp. HCB2-198 TaxID=3383025 RepID=UPI0038B6A5B1
MKKEKMKTEIEVFICNHSRDSGDDNCAAKGAKELTDKLKKWAKEEHKGEMKVFRSGCLGKCSEGIAIACYPQKKFLLEVVPEDYKEIKEGLEEALKDIKD